MKPNFIFAIDQSIASSAVVIIEVSTGDVVDFDVIKTTKDFPLGLFGRVQAILTGMHDVRISAEDSDEVVWYYCREGLGFGVSKSNASRDLAYLVGAIENAFETPFQEVPPTTLKKFATGSGKADKGQMIEALPQYYRVKFEQAGYKKTTGLADLADAYFIGKYFLDKLLTDKGF